MCEPEPDIQSEHTDSEAKVDDSHDGLCLLDEETSKARAKIDKMKIKLKNCSQDDDPYVNKFYRKWMDDKSPLLSDSDEETTEKEIE